MRVKLGEICWHERQRVLSLDFDASGRLATGGSDNNVNVRENFEIIFLIDSSEKSYLLLLAKSNFSAAFVSFTQIWRLTINEDGSFQADIQASLSRHTKSVNVVRFAPVGELLASGGDGMQRRIFINRISEQLVILIKSRCLFL